MPRRAGNGKNGHSAGAPNKTGHDAHVDDDGCLVLRGELFWKWRAVESDYARVNMELKAKIDELNLLMSKDDTIRRVFGERQALLNESSVKKKELADVQEQIEKILGVSLKNCAINDQTGRITELLEGGKSVPLLAKKPSKSRKSRAGAS